MWRRTDRFRRGPLHNPRCQIKPRGSHSLTTRLHHADARPVTFHTSTTAIGTQIATIVATGSFRFEARRSCGPRAGAGPCRGVYPFAVSLWGVKWPLAHALVPAIALEFQSRLGSESRQIDTCHGRDSRLGPVTGSWLQSCRGYKRVQQPRRQSMFGVATGSAVVITQPTSSCGAWRETERSIR